MFRFLRADKIARPIMPDSRQRVKPVYFKLQKDHDWTTVIRLTDLLQPITLFRTQYPRLAIILCIVSSVQGHSQNFCSGRVLPSVPCRFLFPPLPFSRNTTGQLSTPKPTLSICRLLCKIAVNGTPSQNYGVSLAIWDHTALPAT